MIQSSWTEQIYNRQVKSCTS